MNESCNFFRSSFFPPYLTFQEHWEHFLFVEDQCIVGRKDSALLIPNDPSVSRKHAILVVRHPEEHLAYPSKQSSLFLRDEGSKYGTFKNGVRVSSEEQLVDGDVVKFGQFESEFRVHYIPLVVTTSCLDIASKNTVKKVIHLLGGHLVSEWQPSCTHLVMSQVKVTIKAVCCLVSLKSIVLPEYFEELERKLRSSSTIISPNEFIPPIGESLIDKDKVSFDVNPERKNLFKNKTFFFMDEKQFKKLHLGIIMGGGNASILSEEKGDLDMLLHEASCFIEPIKSQTPKEESKNFLKEIIATLQKKNLRMIPESDIGLAVAYASTEKFCNPSFNIGSAVLGSQKIPSQTLSEREVYVPDTQRSGRHSSPPKIDSLFISNTQQKFKKQKLEDASSFNLTSLREDPEDPEKVFEIPLSAEVKQELDDLFDITMKDVNQDVQMEETLPTVLPVRHKTTVKHSIENVTSKKEVSEVISKPAVKKEEKAPTEPKLEEKSALDENGLALTLMNCGDEENLPRNLMKVQFASLICQRAVLSDDQQNRNFHVKNFKKFKKVYPVKAQALPRIIGGHDLIPYDRDAAKFSADNWDDDVQVKNDQPIKGAFDWDTPA